MLGEGSVYGINGSFGLPEKNFSITFTKANTKLCLSLHYNAGNSFLFVNWKETFKFKTDNKNVNSQLIFVSQVLLMGLVPQSLEKYLYMEIFQSITTLLIIWYIKSSQSFND